VKTVNILIFFGLLIAVLICDGSLVWAQPTRGPVADDGESTSSGDASTSPDDESPSEANSIVVDDADSPWSQGVSAEDRQAARKLLLEGNRLFWIPLYAKAAEQYIAALSKWKHPAIYFNLAIAQLNLGKEIEARENLEHALEHGEAPLGAKRFREAQKQLAEVRRQIGRIRVICRTPGAEVTLDGITLFIGPGSYEGWVKAKTHELTAKKAGYLSEARRVAVLPERLQDIELKLVTLSQATDANRRWAAWKPWIVVAAGGAVAAAGGVLHGLSARDFNGYDAGFLKLECAAPSETRSTPGCTEEQIRPDLRDQLNLARREQSIAVGAYVVGGASIAVGVVLLYLNRPRLIEQAPARLSARSVLIVPTVSVDMLGIRVSVNH
jgi:tetratricopeptide (TPR) repeat protein